MTNINRISLVPFVDFDETRASIPDMVQNVLFFIPFGFLGRLCLQNRTGTLIIILLLGGFLSLSVEILQIFTTDRTSSVTDLITNTTGTLLGIWFCLFGIYISKILLFNSKIKCFLYSKRLFPVIVFFIVVLLHSIHPFDFSLDIGSILGKAKIIIVNISHFNLILRDEPLILFQFFILSFFVTDLLKEERIKNYNLYSLLFCTSLGIILEMVQLIVMSRMPGIQDIIVVIIGCLTGNIYAVKGKFLRIESSKKKGILIVLIICICSLAYFSHPFKLVGETENFNWFPFLAHYNNNFFGGISNYIEIFLLFFTMGFFIQYYNIFNNNNMIFSFFTAMCISGCLEYLQIWIPNRYPDITDVIISCTGVIFGTLCAKEGWSFFNDYLQRTKGNIKY